MRKRKKSTSVFLVIMMLFALIIPQGALAQTQETQPEVTFSVETNVAQTATGDSATVSSITWGGNGTDSEDCNKVDENRGTVEDGWIHWVVNTKGDSFNPELVLSGTGSGSYQPGEPLNASIWHFYTPYFDVNGLEATLNYEGTLGNPGAFRISDYCQGQEPEPEVLHVSPILECVEDNGDGTYTAHWGYANYNEDTVDAEESYFTGGVLDGSEPMSEGFLPGRQVKVFSTEFDGENLVWTLVGPDGSTRTATASSDSQRCGKTEESIKPVLECVEDLGNGQYRAWFGYLSENDVPVDAMESKFTGGGTLGETTTPPLTNFLPGRHYKVFSTTFDGSNLVWSLKGPDGNNRTSTASSDSKICENEEDELLPLTVESICSGETGILSKWVITNPNDVDVTFDWRLVDDPDQNGTHTATPGISEIETDMVLGASNTFEMTIDGEVIAVTDRFCYEELQLVAVCTDDPETTYNWKINNTNPYSVEVTWRVLDSELTGTMTVPGESSNTFSTTPGPGESDIAIISVNGKVQNTGEGVVSSSELCPVTPPVDDPPVEEPPVEEPPVEEPPVDNPPEDDGPITTVIIQDPPQETINIPDLGIPALPSDDVLLDEVIEFEEEAPAAPVAPPLPDTGEVSPAIFITAGLLLIATGTMFLRRREV